MYHKLDGSGAAIRLGSTLAKGKGGRGHVTGPTTLSVRGSIAQLALKWVKGDSMLQAATVCHCHGRHCEGAVEAVQQLADEGSAVEGIVRHCFDCTRWSLPLPPFSSHCGAQQIGALCLVMHTLPRFLVRPLPLFFFVFTIFLSLCAVFLFFCSSAPSYFSTSCPRNKSAILQSTWTAEHKRKQGRAARPFLMHESAAPRPPPSSCRSRGNFISARVF